MCRGHGALVGLPPPCVPCASGCSPPLCVRFFVPRSEQICHEINGPPYSRRLVGVYPNVVPRPLTVVAVRSMNVRDPNWGTLGAFLGPLVDQWNCKRSGVQLTNAEHGGSASCERGGGAANLSMPLDVLSAVAPTRRPACLVGNAECAEQMGKWIGMNGQEARATTHVHPRNDKCVMRVEHGREGAVAWGEEG